MRTVAALPSSQETSEDMRVMEGNASRKDSAASSEQTRCKNIWREEGEDRRRECEGRTVTAEVAQNEVDVRATPRCG